jgi:hypothetical protein
MISLDHIAVWSNNLFEATYRLSEQTGVGNCDGGFFPGLGLGQKVISLGGDVYIEVESVVNHRMILERERIALEMERQIANGDCFVSWCLRSDDMNEMEAFAKYRGVPMAPGIPGGKFRMSGETTGVANVPVFWDSWFIGKPNLYYVPDLSRHSSRLPIQQGTGTVTPQGVTALEIGGTRNGLKEWLGDVFDPDDFPFDIVYNGGSDGLYAVTFATDDGEKTIRLNAVTL